MHLKNREVPSLAILNCLPKPTKAGEQVYCKKEDAIYISTIDGEWIPKGSTLEVQTSLYDYTQSALSSTTENITDFSKLKEYITNLQKQANNTYYMLLSNENKYYTIFETNNPNGEQTFVEEVIEVIGALGPVRDYSEIEGGIEVWLVPNGSELAYPFYLFPYDLGVIKTK